MLLEAERVYPLETGGILIGYVGDNDEYVISHVIGPGPNASHSKFGFKPDHEYQQSKINLIFNESEGGYDYLGDWHTHPKGKCAMSWIDHRTFQRIGTTAGVNISSPVMMILCNGTDEWNVSAWMFVRPRWLYGAEIDDLIVECY